MKKVQKVFKTVQHYFFWNKYFSIPFRSDRIALFKLNQITNLLRSRNWEWFYCISIYWFKYLKGLLRCELTFKKSTNLIHRYPDRSYSQIFRQISFTDILTDLTHRYPDRSHSQISWQISLTDIQTNLTDILTDLTHRYPDRSHSQISWQISLTDIQTNLTHRYPDRSHSQIFRNGLNIGFTSPGHLKFLSPCAYSF